MDLKEALEKIVVTPSAHKDLEERVERYHEQLFSPEGAEALDYLKSARGFDESTIRHFKLGYVADPLPIDRGMAQGRLAIPHKTLSGYRTIRFRVMGECPQGVPKYWQPAGTTVGIFGVEALGDVTPSITLAEGECLPGDAEALTPSGWVRLDELQAGVEVAQWSPSGIQYAKPLARIEKEYAGDLIEYSNSRRYYSLTTPGHGMPELNPKTGKLRKVEAELGGRGHTAIPRAGRLDGPGTGLTRDELAFMLAVSADAAIRRKGEGKYKMRADKYLVFSFRKVRKATRLVGLLERLGIEYSGNPIKGGYFSICFSMPEKYTWMDRKLPFDLLGRMTSAEREFVVSELTEWDGNSVPNRDQTEYSSKYRHNVDWVQALAHTSGRVSTVIKRRNQYGEWYKASILNRGSSTSWSTAQSNKKTVPYMGKVYCVTVPTGYFMVRQNGCVSVTGNCDAMILWQCGIPAIGFPGAQSVKDHHAFLLEGFERTYICGDGDDAGTSFTNKLANMVPNPIPITLPDGKDINEIYIEGGRKAVVDLLGIED